jgi:hypothetical protein
VHSPFSPQNPRLFIQWTSFETGILDKFYIV